MEREGRDNLKIDVGGEWWEREWQGADLKTIRGIFFSSDYLVSEDAGIESMTIATIALAVRRSKHSARSNPHSLENRRRWGVRGRKGQRMDNLKIDGGGE